MKIKLQADLGVEDHLPLCTAAICTHFYPDDDDGDGDGDDKDDDDDDDRYVAVDDDDDKSNRYWDNDNADGNYASLYSCHMHTLLSR